MPLPVGERSNLAFAVATGNGRRVHGNLTEDADVQSIIQQLSTTEGTFPLVKASGIWFALQSSLKPVSRSTES